MNEIEYKEFIKRYDEFRENNLPTPFWDEERQVLEYVYFYNKQLKVTPKLSEALGEIAFTGFYYPFTDKHIVGWKENDKFIQKCIIGHNHVHSFEEVVRALYNSPESFNIAKDEEQYYSKQELEYLTRVQKYLLFIGMKDLKIQRNSNNRFKNKKYSKYKNAVVYRLSNDVLCKVINKEIDFKIMKWYSEYSGNKTYKPKEYQALIVDEEYNFIMLVEFTYEELKLYKDIKSIYKRDDFKDEDKVIISHFKILEFFN